MKRIDDDKAREVNLALARYFKSQGITQRDIARRLGYTNVNSVANLLSYGRFGKRVATKWANEFGFNESFLITGRGNLVRRQSSYQKLVQENETLHAIVRVQKEIISNRPDSKDT